MARLIEEKTFYNKPWYNSYRCMMSRCYREKACEYMDENMETDCILYRRQTNGDKIRKMTNEELAKEIEHVELIQCRDIVTVNCGKIRCHVCIKKWLDEEVEDDEP